MVVNLGVYGWRLILGYLQCLLNVLKTFKWFEKLLRQSLGNAVVSTTHFVADVGEMVADGAVDLAGDALQVAQYAVSQGATLGLSRWSKVGKAHEAHENSGEICGFGEIHRGWTKTVWRIDPSFLFGETQKIAVGHEGIKLL